jgi:uncharacterized protein YbjQ (UPF0145 family)
MAFTSDLSTSDFWLLRKQGYMPLGLVVGNSVYSMGVVGGMMTGIKGMGKGEIPQITELLYNARMMALNRMLDEANKLGADGVIAVKLNINYMHNGEWMEVTAIGTGVKKVDNGSMGGRGSDDPMVMIPMKTGDVKDSV